MIDINKKTLKKIISICILTIFNIGCVSLESQSVSLKTQDKKITSETDVVPLIRPLNLVFISDKSALNI